MNMVKRSKVPSGFYSGREAAERLNMPIASFYRQVRKGEITKYISPGATEGFFKKQMIDEMAHKRALFMLVHSIEPITFDRVQSEEDIRGIVDLCIDIYGQGGTPSYDARMEIWQKNPEVYYIVRQEGIIAGYISLIWFDDEALAVLMGPTSRQARRSSAAGTGVYSVTGPEHIHKFVEGQPIDSLFISLGVRPGFSNTEQREYAFKLLRGTQDIIIDFAQRGMPIRKIYATSERGEGIRMARKLGMKEIKYPGDSLLRYELDLEASDHPLLQAYKQILAQKHHP